MPLTTIMTGLIIHDHEDDFKRKTKEALLLRDDFNQGVGLAVSTIWTMLI